MAVVLLLLHFVAGNEDIVAPGRDDVIAAVGGGVPDGLMFAHEEDGDAGGEAAEGWSCGGGEGDVVPGSGVGEAGLQGRG